MTVSAATVEDLVDRLVGTWLLGKYRVDGLLGWGGAAAVFAATHRNGHRVAVKLLHPSIATDENVRSRFLREGYLANKVGHVGAVRVLDDDRLPDGSVFLVMELLEGKALDVKAADRKGKLPLKTVCNIAYQLLDVLGAAHDKGIVHRDIKPQNLFLTRDGVVKVLDFGLARFVAPEASQVITQTGDVFGTPAFMAPEQAIGDMDRVDAASDQWSAASSLFNLVTGVYVHDAKTPTEMMVYCATRPARSIRDVDKDIPPRIGNVLDRALRFRKEERWPHVRDFQRALKLAYESTYGSSLAMPKLAQVTSSMPPLTGKVTSARARAARIAVAATTAAVVTGLGILAVRAMVAEPPAALVETESHVATPSHVAAEPAAVEASAENGPTVAPAAMVTSSARPVASTKPAAAPVRPIAAPPASPKKPDPWSAQ